MSAHRYAARRVGIRVSSVIGAGSVISLGVMGPALAQSANFDGSYAGQQTLAESSSSASYASCLRGPFKRKLTVNNGAVAYTYNPTYHGELTGTVNADGDVSAYASTPEGGVKLAGKIQGGDFTGEVWSVFCTYSLQLKRAP